MWPSALFGRQLTGVFLPRRHSYVLPGSSSTFSHPGHAHRMLHRSRSPALSVGSLDAIDRASRAQVRKMRCICGDHSPCATVCMIRIRHGEDIFFPCRVRIMARCAACRRPRARNGRISGSCVPWSRASSRGIVRNGNRPFLPPSRLHVLLERCAAGRSVGHHASRCSRSSNGRLIMKAAVWQPHPDSRQQEWDGADHRPQEHFECVSVAIHQRATMPLLPHSSGDLRWKSRSCWIGAVISAPSSIQQVPRTSPTPNGALANSSIADTQPQRALDLMQMEVIPSLRPPYGRMRLLPAARWRLTAMTMPVAREFIPRTPLWN
jgi:hypothetical protein